MSTTSSMIYEIAQVLHLAYMFKIRKREHLDLKLKNASYEH